MSASCTIELKFLSYRATLCKARYQLLAGLRPSVCLSVCVRVYCIETAKDYHQTFFSAWRSHHSTFRIQAPLHNCKRNFSAWALNKHGLSSLRPLSRYILETAQDRSVVTTERQQEVIGTRSTSSDLERPAPFFGRIYTLLPFDQQRSNSI